MTVRPEDLARTLRLRHSARRQQEARRREEVRARLLREAPQVLRGHSVRRAWLIGSLARGDFGPGSDIDLVVEGVALEDWPALWAELGDRLGVEVDLLRLEELGTEFQRRVRAEGEVLDVA